MEKSGYIEKGLCNDRAMGGVVGKGKKEANEEGRKRSEGWWKWLT